MVRGGLVHLFLLFCIRFRKEHMEVTLALDLRSSAYLFVNSMSPSCLVWSQDLLELQCPTLILEHLRIKTIYVFLLSKIFSLFAFIHLVHFVTLDTDVQLADVTVTLFVHKGTVRHKTTPKQELKNDLTVKVYKSHPLLRSTVISVSSLGNSSTGEKPSVLVMLSSSSRYLMQYMQIKVI